MIEFISIDSNLGAIDSCLTRRMCHEGRRFCFAPLNLSRPYYVYTRQMTGTSWSQAIAYHLFVTKLLPSARHFQHMVYWQ